MSDTSAFRLSPREHRLDALKNSTPDVLIIGGGITGAGVALDMTLRGASVALIEKGDWAGGTSSSSSRLIHGGLRYLETFDISLVRESVRERGMLLRNAGGLVWPLRFMFPVRKGDRVGLFKLKLGLWLYAGLAFPRQMELPSGIGEADVSALLPGISPDGLRGAGLYPDAGTDDARLTLAVVLSASKEGAIATSRVEATHIEQGNGGVEVEVRDVEGGGTFSIRARSVVLCGGPGTDRLRKMADLSTDWILPTRGTHILIPRNRLPTDGAVILPSAVDGRIMFFIPWPGYTVIGTTDIDASPDEPIFATREEVEYLLASANALVPEAGLTISDVHSAYAGLRPLLHQPGKSPSARSREERIDRHGSVFTIAGGKLTGYRSMAERLSSRLAAQLRLGRPGKKSPTRHYRLLGAGEPMFEYPDWSHLPLTQDADTRLNQAWSRRYAARTEEVKSFVSSVESGRDRLDADTLLGEVDWAVEHEDCRDLSDFLLRRTDCGRGLEEDIDRIVHKVMARMSALLQWDGQQEEAQQTNCKRDRALTQQFREGSA